MTDRIVHHAIQERRVQNHDRPGNGRHSPRHDDEQLTAADLGEIGADEQWRLNHAHKYIGSRAAAHRTADAHRTTQGPGEALHDDRQDPPVVEQRRKGADDEDQGQCLERQHE